MIALRLSDAESAWSQNQSTSAPSRRSPVADHPLLSVGIPRLLAHRAPGYKKENDFGRLIDRGDRLALVEHVMAAS